MLLVYLIKKTSTSWTSQHGWSAPHNGQFTAAPCKMSFDDDEYQRSALRERNRGRCARKAAVAPSHDAETVMLDFVQPPGAGRRHLRGRWQAGLDNSQPRGGYAHATLLLGMTAQRVQSQASVAPAIVGAWGASRGWSGAWRSYSRRAYWGKRGGFCIVPLDRTVRQSSSGTMGFNRRKLEDQRRKQPGPLNVGWLLTHNVAGGLFFAGPRRGEAAIGSLFACC
jgi:hypothetical protein